MASARRCVAALERALIEPAQPLAALRIAVSVIILVSPELRDAADLAGNPCALDVLPEGLGWLARWSISPGVVSVLQVCAALSAVTALLGFWSRCSLFVLTVSGALVFSFSQRSGAVLHDMHVFWFSALLSVSRSGDVCSLDARGKPAPSASLRYGVPAALARLLLGVLYLFPGLYDLQQMRRGAGAGAGFRTQQYVRWFELGEVPSIRLDHFPVWCVACAWFVVAFQLSFVVLAQWRKTRWLAAASGLAFHVGLAALLFPLQSNLWACYVILLPFGASTASLRNRLRIQRRTPAAVPLPALFVAGVLLLAEARAAALGRTNAWPFALYPTFALAARSTLPDLEFEVQDAAGHVIAFTGLEKLPRPPYEWHRVYYLANAYGSPATSAALREMLRMMAQRAGVSLRTATRASIFRIERPIAPGDWNAPPLGRTKLWQVSCEPSVPGARFSAECRALHEQ